MKKNRPIQKNDLKHTNHSLLYDFFIEPPSVFIFVLLTILPVMVYGQTIGFDFVWDDMDLHLKYLLPTSEVTLLDFWKMPIEKQYAPFTFTIWSLIPKVGPNTAAVISPVFAFVVIHFLFRVPFYRALKLMILPCLFMIPIVLLTLTSQNYAHPNIDVPFWTHPFIFLFSINFYLYKIIIPFSLTASYAITPVSLVAGKWVYLSWVVPGLIGYVLYRTRKTHAPLLISFLLFIIGYLPTSGLFSFPFQTWSTVSDRYINLSMVGISIFVAYLLSLKKDYRMISGAALIVLLLAFQSFKVQVPTWHNNFTLWDHCLKVTPDEALAYRNRGLELSKKRQYQNTLSDFNMAAKIYPNNPKVYNDRGAVFYSLKKGTETYADFNKAITLDSSFEDAYFNRGLLLLIGRKYPKALEDFSAAIHLNPKSYQAFC